MCGSGTTCKAAAQLKRNYIGMDISEEYCELARNRLELPFSLKKQTKTNDGPEQPDLLLGIG